MQIVPRAEWGARPPRSRFLITTPTPKLYLHHTASPTGGPARVRAIQDFHMDVRGWSDIAYSYLVSAAGIIYEGRGAGVAGGHTAGQNTVSHAICAMGNYDNDTPSPGMLDSIRLLLAHGHAQGWWPAQFTGGHRDAPGAATSCPGGKLYALIPMLNQPLPQEDDEMKFIEAKDEKGPHVEYWQRIMSAIDPPWKPTVFGTWNAHSITELQKLTGPGGNLGPAEAAVLHTALAQQGSGGLNDAQVKALITSTGGQLFVEKGKPVVIRGS